MLKGEVLIYWLLKNFHYIIVEKERFQFQAQTYVSELQCFNWLCGISTFTQ